MGFTLYVDLRSQPCRAVVLFLKKSGVDFKQVELDLFKGEHMQDWFKKINRKPAVPTLLEKDDKNPKDAGFVLPESTAIIRYIATKMDKEKKLLDKWYPTDPRRIARVQEFLGWYSTTVRKNCITVFLGMMKGEGKHEEAEKAIEEAITYIDEHFLDGNPFIGGAKMSVADIIGACELYQLHGCDQLERFLKPNKNVKEWMQRVEKEFKSDWKTVHVALNGCREGITKAQSAQKK